MATKEVEKLARKIITIGDKALMKSSGMSWPPQWPVLSQAGKDSFRAIARKLADVQLRREQMLRHDCGGRSQTRQRRQPAQRAALAQSALPGPRGACRRRPAAAGGAMSRLVCQFSCGAASAVATKLTLADNQPDEVIIVNAFIREEHEDNRRFLRDCEVWFAHPIIVLSDQTYNASIREVWRRVRFMKGLRGAPCSIRLKREILNSIQLPGDVKVMGFTSEEADRFERLCDRFPQEWFRAPLIERGITKQDCYTMIDRAGIQLPAMYRKGYPNANCRGCVKGGIAYWQSIRDDFPADFAETMEIQDGIGPGAYFLRFRSGPRKNERMSLRELPPGRGDMKAEPEFSCSAACELASNEIDRGEP